MMKKEHFRWLAFFTFLPFIAGIALGQSKQETQALWYDTAAKNWLEALPLGNGTLGAMVFGGIQQEVIQFNESSLVSGSPNTMGYYQPFGSIKITQPISGAIHYHRRLCLDSAVQTVSFQTATTGYKREYFISYPDKAMVVRYTSNTKNALNGTIELNDAHNAQIVVNGRSIMATGTLKENNMQYQSRLWVNASGGTMSSDGHSIQVSNADEFTLYVVAATAFDTDINKGFTRDLPTKSLENQLNQVANTPFPQLLQRHLTDFGALYHRVQFRLGSTPQLDTLPTNKRLVAYHSNGGTDNGLEALLYQYGRYLLIASSRTGGLPANLQGIWNNEYKPAWYAQYTTNINVEMNYWLAEQTNLSECHFPLLHWIETLAAASKQSKDAALQTQKGWLCYSTNNLFGAPSTWRLHRPGAAWLTQHFWEHYAFTQDKSFLSQRAYPLLKEIVEYWEGHLVPNKAGRFISPDGWSPEHGPNLNETDKSPYPGASYDQQIVYDLFTNYIEVATILQRDTDYCKKITQLRNQMLPPQIGKWGQLQEWMEDVDRQDDHHRHNSHLFAVHPGRQINPILTPELAKAAVVSLDARGNKSTGWSTAWKINIYARLMQGNKAHDQIKALIKPAPESKGISTYSGGLYPNLFDAHPPFQIDGNFGYTSGVTEMLLQSQAGFIHFLPALPNGWKEGTIKGLKARGNLTVDIYWKNSQLTKAIVKPTISGKYIFRVGDTTKTIAMVSGRKYELDGALNDRN